MRRASTRLIGSIIFASAVAAAGCAGPAQQAPVESTTPVEEPAEEPVEQPVEEAAAPAAEETTEPEAAQSEEEAAAEAEAKEKEEQAKRVAAVMKRIEEAAAEESARWTPELRKQAQALLERKYRNPKAALKAILASPHRKPGNADRDVHRHPLKTLSFFGIRPNMTVVEVGGGSGWYTELLAPLLAKRGKLLVSSYDPNGPKDSIRSVYGARFKLFLDKSPELFGKVETMLIDPPDEIVLGPAGSADLAIAIREMHNWKRGDALEAYLQAVHAVLKPGGTFGVVQHRAPADADAEESAGNGYLPEAWLIEQIEAAGFKLVKKSEVNANPKDTKDYERGVWTLPPSLALDDKDRAKYEAIGESDRMTLKFVKTKN